VALTHLRGLLEDELGPHPLHVLVALDHLRVKVIRALHGDAQVLELFDRDVRRRQRLLVKVRLARQVVVDIFRALDPFFAGHHQVVDPLRLRRPFEVCTGCVGGCGEETVRREKREEGRRENTFGFS
jgi:hypothetical protein